MNRSWRNNRIAIFEMELEQNLLAITNLLHERKTQPFQWKHQRLYIFSSINLNTARLLLSKKRPVYLLHSYLRLHYIQSKMIIPMNVAFGEPKNIAENSNNHHNNFEKIFIRLLCGFLFFHSLTIIFIVYFLLEICKLSVHVQTLYTCTCRTMMFANGLKRRSISIKLNIHQVMMEQADVAKFNGV